MAMGPVRRPPGLGDYPAILPYRVVRKEGEGPLDPPVDATENCLEYLCQLMEKMLCKFAWYQRNGVSFIANGEAGVAVAAGATAFIAQFQVPTDYPAILMRVGVDCSPAPGFALVVWDLMINEAAQPYFTGMTFMASNLTNPDEFVAKLPQSSLVQLRATNNNIGQVTLNAILRGFVAVDPEP